jgi:RNA polymerase-binding transcription factor
MTLVLPDLHAEYARLDADYAAAIERHRALLRDLADDSAGDDVADAGTKAAVSDLDEAELRFITQRRQQMERAMERLDAGGYGLCERCGREIPAERLALFPHATSCVTCKQNAERFARR